MHNRQSRQRRLNKLGWGELVASIVVPACGLWISWPWGDTWPVQVLGAASLAMMLVSAALFWLMRARQILSEARLGHVSTAMLVSVAVAGAALLLAVISPWDASRPMALIVGLAIPLFTILEWVNYRWVQISAGGLIAALRGKPIKPQLAKMLNRARPTRTTNPD